MDMMDVRITETDDLWVVYNQETGNIIEIYDAREQMNAFIVRYNVYNAKLNSIEIIMTGEENKDCDYQNNWEEFYNWKKEILCSTNCESDFFRAIDNKLYELVGEEYEL